MAQEPISLSPNELRALGGLQAPASQHVDVHKPDVEVTPRHRAVNGCGRKRNGDWKRLSL